jgi:fructuronate reductase
MRSAGVRDALARTDFVYHVVEVGNQESRDEVVRPIGSLLGVTVAAEGVEEALARLADPQVNVVTITVTEHGYCAVAPGGPLDLARPEVVHDLADPHAPRSVPGLVLEALVRRRAVGIAPFTVVSCDNLPANGAAVARVVGDLAECRDSQLAAWLASSVAFPSSMVDRMVPATTTADLARCRALGVIDEWPIITEPFLQWVLEDSFPQGRPDWGSVGVELVADVRDHEQAKLCILNAAHSALAYWGLLAGHEYIWQAAVDPVVLAAVRDLIETEALPTLHAPHGWDLHDYAAAVLDRFANRSLAYTTAKVAGDGSQKLAVRILPTLRSLLATGRPAPRCAQVLAAWVAVMAGPRSSHFDVVDASFAGAGAFASAQGRGVTAAAAAHAMVSLPGLLDTADQRERAFVDLVAAVAAALWRGDVRDVLRKPPASLPALQLSSEGPP